MQRGVGICAYQALICMSKLQSVLVSCSNKLKDAHLILAQVVSSSSGVHSQLFVFFSPGNTMRFIWNFSREQSQQSFSE